MAVQTFTDLIVWQKAMDFVEAVYRATAAFPKEEMYGLTSQVRRAVVSVPSNIAEGQSRQTTQDFLRFLSIARGSLAEVHTQVIIAKRLGYLDEASQIQLIEALDEVRRLLNGLIRSLAPNQP